MSRLCRLKTASHGDDGKWAYNEIVSLRKQRDELLAAMIHIQQVACSGSPELGIATAAIASVKGEQ